MSDASDFPNIPAAKKLAEQRQNTTLWDVVSELGSIKYAIPQLNADSLQSRLLDVIEPIKSGIFHLVVIGWIAVILLLVDLVHHW